MFKHSLIALILTLTWQASSFANPAALAFRLTAAAVATSGAYYLNNSLKELKKQTHELEEQNALTTKELKTLKKQNALILSKVYDMEIVVDRVNKRFEKHQTTNEALDPESPDFFDAEGEVDEHVLTRNRCNESDDDVTTQHGIIVMETDDSE